jgi:ornithine cyclodeaminase/alanine dehydrogenase-like protein (mu-crystallin family)
MKRFLIQLSDNRQVSRPTVSTSCHTHTHTRTQTVVADFEAEEITALRTVLRSALLPTGLSLLSVHFTSLPD